MMNNKVKGIYFHIPFCQTICNYCDFPRVFYNENWSDRYLIELEREYNSYSINKEDITSIYIGGGTPSSLSGEQLKYLFSIIDVNSFINLEEFTFELNPESIDEDKIKILALNKVNRVSIGVQTFNDELLTHMNRKHTKDMVYEVIALLRKYSIDNISIDLMYGFTNQSIDDIKNDLLEVERLDINHIAYYSLIIEENTIFNNSNYQINEDELVFDEFICDYLVNRLGYEHYEISNFQKGGNYSKHNLLYWDNERYYGFGLGAGGFIENYRYYNTRSITKYLNGEYLLSIDFYLNSKDYLVDEIMLNFRKLNGIDLKKYDLKYSLDFTKFFNNVIITNINNLEIVDNKLYFTNQGKKYINNIIVDFIDKIKEES